MGKRVLSVGQCGPDQATLCRYITGQFEAEVDGADSLDEALQKLRAHSYDLVLINRKLDADYSDGTAVLKAIKAEPGAGAVPVMLVTNYPEHQEAAVAAGAERGFGKLEYQKPETCERLGRFLARKAP